MLSHKDFVAVSQLKWNKLIELVPIFQSGSYELCNKFYQLNRGYLKKPAFFTYANQYMVTSDYNGLEDKMIFFD